MNAPFQSTLNPYASQYGTPSAMAYGSGDQNPNPSPVSASASNPLGWANMNTYAPWATPNGSTGSNPSFGDAGSWGSSGQGGMTNWNDAMGSIGGSWFGLSKKYNLPDTSSPSYQGTLFNPDTGPYAQNYLGNLGLSPEGTSSDQSLQNSMQGMSPTSSNQPLNPLSNSSLSGLSGSQYAGANGLQSSQSYVGQNPYGVAGSSYVPSQSGMSYGGYSNYGGYGNSGSGMYVPGQ